jgi:Golgi SNAP receptor complex protein 1
MQEFYRLRSSLRVKQQHASLLDLRDFDRAKFDVEEAGESEALLREQAAIGRNSGQVGLSRFLGLLELLSGICIFF